MAAVEEIDIVIVGGGICGLATALALHRKGIRSVVLERSDTLRVTGAAIGVFPNGWRALHVLGLDSSLRPTAIQFRRAVDVWTEKGVERETLLSGEARCLRRNDLIEALANALPLETIRFGCQVVSLNVERSSSYAVLQLHDGSLIKAKVLIGCDGANSVIANYIGLKPTRPFSSCAIRGLTFYPNGHGYAPEFLRVRKGKYLVGRIPIDETTVYWFVVLQWTQRADAEMPRDPVSIRKMALDIVAGFSKDIMDMIEKSDLTSLSFTHLRYRAPWNLLSGNFRKDTVTVAGDAWHVMGPFLGQGGSAALEDAIVLARCLSKKIFGADLNESRMQMSAQKAVEALDEYLKERRWRVLLLSTQAYLRGLLLAKDSSFLVRCLSIMIIAVLFRDPSNHTRYDCGVL